MPLIWYAADSLNDISKKLAPIGSVKYLHKRTEDKRKFEVVDESNTRMSPGLQLVCDYLNSKGDTHNLLDLEKMTGASREISSSDKDKADLLLVKLREQFKEHVNLQVKQVSKRNHWVLKLAWKNLSVVASIMLLSNHLKMELKCLGEHTCLLAVNMNQFIPSGVFPNCEAAYLYFDGNRGVFVRSGKVVRQGFKGRGEEHLACAK